MKRWTARRYRTNELTYRVYLDLRKYGLGDHEICKLFGIAEEQFRFFVDGHEAVFAAKRKGEKMYVGNQKD